MIISRSMTLRSSRTLPGQRSCAAPPAPPASSALQAPAVLARRRSAMKCSASSGMSSCAVAQRRHEDRDDVQAEVEVLAEPARPDLARQVLVGRREHAHVHPDARRAADRLDDLLLQHAQHLGLRLQAHVADLVEEERAAVGELELAAPVGDRAGERAAHVAEQLALDQLLGDRRAVDLDERAARAGGSARGSLRATSSLPVPFSPKISTRPLVGAAIATCSRSWRMA